QAAARVAGLDRPDRGVRRNEVLCHAGTPKAGSCKLSGSCESSCNVISDLAGRRETRRARKKPQGVDFPGASEFPRTFGDVVGRCGGGEEEDRTPDLRIANPALSHLS